LHTSCRRRSRTDNVPAAHPSQAAARSNCSPPPMARPRRSCWHTVSRSSCLLIWSRTDRTAQGWGEDDYDVLADGVVVGRIVKAQRRLWASPGCGQCSSATSRTARQRTATQRPARMQWAHSPKAGGGSVMTRNEYFALRRRYEPESITLVIIAEYTASARGEPGGTSGSIHGLGYLFSALRREGLIADDWDLLC
jgi:hypothetical protein